LISNLSCNDFSHNFLRKYWKFNQVSENLCVKSIFSKINLKSVVFRNFQFSTKIPIWNTDSQIERIIGIFADGYFNWNFAAKDGKSNLFTVEVWRLGFLKGFLRCLLLQSRRTKFFIEQCFSLFRETRGMRYCINLNNYI